MLFQSASRILARGAHATWLLTWFWMVQGLVGAGLAASSANATEVQLEVAARSAGEVEIHGLAGRVEVVGWDRSRVAVDGTLGPGIDRLDLDQQGSRIVLRPVLSDDQRAGQAGAFELRVRVPKASQVKVDTVDATILTRDLVGALALETVGGSIRTEGRGSRQVLVTTASGVVELAAPSLRGRVRTASGSVTTSATLDDLAVVTASGAITVVGDVVEELRLETAIGPIEIEGAVAATGRLVARSHDAPIRLRLPGDLAARLRLESRRGTVHSALGGSADGVATASTELNLVVGGGGPLIDVESLDGDIWIETR